MTTVPQSFSPFELKDGQAALASGPFVIEITLDDSGETISDIGYLLTRAGEDGFSWSSTDYMHDLTPVGPVEESGDEIRFSTDAGSFLLRPVEFGDGAIVGLDEAATPANEEETRRYVEMLKLTLWSAFNDETPDPEPLGENDLYVTRDGSGEILALIKTGSSFATLVRSGGSWRRMGDSDDELLGDQVQPVGEEAVVAYDAGDIPRIEKLLMDDRFSPNEVLRIWGELDGDTEQLERLLVERSRDRFYERTRAGTWAEAKPNDDAVTIDMVFNAIGAWDDGSLRSLSDVAPFDADGDVA